MIYIRYFFQLTIALSWIVAAAVGLKTVDSEILSRANPTLIDSVLWQHRKSQAWIIFLYLYAFFVGIPPLFFPQQFTH
ncbi:MAG: hypothetical protein QNJ41_13915 [Xenococcaceae cyanobacterium MO_188.B32]|nr:hypothetical protein [Xenococcaceae cyanobacterium MO_188.B32]